MDNPWPELRVESPCVLHSDRSTIDAFNARYADEPDFIVRPQLLPEPFIGDPRARVYLLGLNPGYSPEDDAWHADPVYRTAIIDNLSHRTTAFSFYFFDPRLRDAPGSIWWSKRARWLIADVGIETLVRNLFCVELFPYHSRRYKPVPKTVSPDGLVPSSRYSVHLVRQAIRANRPIVAMRAFRNWCELLPELRTYGNLFRLNSAQNVALSPNNLLRYDQLVLELKRAASRIDFARFRADLDSVVDQSIDI